MALLIIKKCSTVYLETNHCDKDILVLSRVLYVSYRRTRILNSVIISYLSRCLVTANQVAPQLLINGRGTMPSKPKIHVLPPATEGDTSKVYPFSDGEYIKGVAALKNNEAADRDDRHIETREGLFDSKELPTYIPLMSHVQTLRNNATEQDRTCHLTTPDQGTCRF